MSDRERLIELIKHCSCYYAPPCDGDCSECHNVEMYDDVIEHIADHLLANGVIEVVRCKDCKYYKDWADGSITCSLWTVDWDVATEPNAFCSYGERGEGNETIQ